MNTVSCRSSARLTRSIRVFIPQYAGLERIPFPAPVKKKVPGKKISGKLLSVDTFFIQIFDSSEKLANISKDTVREMTMTSPMPSYRDKLTTQELADVISYLMSLKGQ